MNKSFFSLGIIVLILISIIGCDRLFPSKSPKTTAKKEEKIALLPEAPPIKDEPEKPQSELKAEIPPPKKAETPSTPGREGEITSAGKESPPKETYLSASPRESAESLVRLASAETFPAAFKRVVAQFTSQEAAKLPRGWEIKEFTGMARAEVVKIDGIYALHLRSTGTSFSVHKDLELDLHQTPYLTWSWKVDKLPPRGDVRSSKSDDQAAQIYLVFPYFPPTLRSKLLGYIWDSTAPKGTVLQSPTINLAKVMVVESGKENLRRWITVTRNVYEDYKILFGAEPPKLGKVAIHINTNRTQSSAESYFANIFFHSAPTAELK